MNIKRKDTVEPELGLTPLVDVVLLLLIFFLLTSSFVTPTSVPVSLPQIEGEQHGSKSGPYVVLEKGGTIKVGKTAVSREELKKKASGWSEEQSEKIPLYCDREASFGTVMEVWKLLRDQGVNVYRVQVSGKPQ